MAAAYKLHDFFSAFSAAREQDAHRRAHAPQLPGKRAIQYFGNRLGFPSPLTMAASTCASTSSIPPLNIAAPWRCARRKSSRHACQFPECHRCGRRKELYLHAAHHPGEPLTMRPVVNLRMVDARPAAENPCARAREMQIARVVDKRRNPCPRSRRAGAGDGPTPSAPPPALYQDRSFRFPPRCAGTICGTTRGLAKHVSASVFFHRLAAFRVRRQCRNIPGQARHLARHLGDIAGRVKWGDERVLLPFPEWRKTVGEKELADLKAAGFDFVRMPIDPSPFLSEKSAALHDKLFEEVAASVKLITDAGLKSSSTCTPCPLAATAPSARRKS